MKKIFLTISIISISFFATAQQLKMPEAEGSKTMTVAESNALNGAAQPTINGIPYSQYKAQQEALKKDQSIQQQAVPLPQLRLATANDAPVIMAPQTETAKPSTPVSKVAGGQYADKTIPGTLVPVPNVSVAQDVPSVTPVENLSQPAPKIEAATSESVAPVKVPASAKQGSGS